MELDVARAAALSLVVGGVAGLLVAERRRFRPALWATKPGASAGLVLLALAGGAPDASWARWVVVGLALSFVGDLLLIPASQRVFRAGIAAFLLAHVAYVVAFVAHGVAWPWVLAAASALVAPGWLVARRLLPRVPRPLFRAVGAYMVVISAMVAAAAGAVGAGAPPWVLAAAVAFYVSDLAVARHRFVVEAYVNRAVGLPLYYGAQVAFAWWALGA
ncbi:MAG TPA: lysoplasmalogenase [Candidatus Thermoplasmatota archaeon]|nr:lysoplasmalogenase [Candidatus Thermoplasmatota archaeon]